MSRLKAATDGSADKPGPGPGGWAWVTSEGTRGWGNCPRTNNIRMELVAVLMLLKSHPDGPLLIQAEAPVTNVFTIWLCKWRKNGMRRANGRVPKNIDLIKQIDELLVGRDIKWQRVRARDGHLLNESADRLASYARLQGKLGHWRY
ncbi:MAG: ribonuclease HI [bacterium]|nr:ribonuclease HI [bacterium]